MSEAIHLAVGRSDVSAQLAMTQHAAFYPPATGTLVVIT